MDLYDFAPVSYIILDKNHDILSANLACAALLEIDRLYLLKKNFLDFVPVLSRDAFKSHLEKLFSTQKKESCELELIKASGEKYYAQIKSIITHAGQVRIAIIDITRRKKMELDLAEYYKKLFLINNLFQSATDAIGALNLELKFEIFNKALEEALFTFFNVKLTNGLNLINIFTDFPEQQQEIMLASQKAMHGKETTIFFNLPHATASLRYYFELKLSPIMDAKKECNGLIFLMRDITQSKLVEQERYKNQAELAHIEKINTMGEMSIALAHEINQPLAAIVAFGQGCLSKLEEIHAEEKDVIQALRNIVYQAEYAGAVMHRMKSFMSYGKLCYEEININELIKNACSLISHQLAKENIKLKFDVAPNLPNLILDRVQISQVILNLLNNSIEAFQKDATLNPEITIRTIYSSANNISVFVIDNGPGLPNEIREIVFNSYYTTKAQGKGLGLAICRAIVEAHGGRIMADVVHHPRTSFQFTLPLIPVKNDQNDQ